MFNIIGSRDLLGNVCNQRCLSVCDLSFCHFVCHSVRNADISETIIARAAKFCMLNLHIKSAKFVEGILKDAFVLEIPNFKGFRRTRYFRRI